MMNTRRWMAAALTAVWLAGSAATAYAQDRGFDRRGPPGAGAHGGGPRGEGPRGWGPPQRAWNPGPGDYRAGPRPMPPPPGYGYGYSGAGPGLRPGGRLPPVYRQPYYVVDQWWGDPRLAPPPRGYHWVQAGSDFVLVAIASGIIASVILGGY